MSTSVIQNPIWDLTLSKFPETDTLPLTSSPGPVLMILALYLLVVLKLGPSFMRKREPYKLTSALIIYNFVQVALSVYLVQRYLRDLLTHGLFPKQCYLQDEKHRYKLVEHIWLYFAAKLTELADTIFFVLRKKDNQVSFLHLYHHSIMFIGTWAFMKYWPSHTLTFIGFLNSLVHVFMYGYYGLAAMGPNVAKYLTTLKKSITKLQLIQFVSMIVQYLVTVKTSDCPPSRSEVTFIASNIGLFLILFLNFYRKSYPKSTKKNEDGLVTNSMNGIKKIN